MLTRTHSKPLRIGRHVLSLNFAQIPKWPSWIDEIHSANFENVTVVLNSELWAKNVLSCEKLSSNLRSFYKDRSGRLDAVFYGAMIQWCGKVGSTELLWVSVHATSHLLGWLSLVNLLAPPPPPLPLLQTSHLSPLCLSKICSSTTLQSFLYRNHPPPPLNVLLQNNEG